MDDVGLPGSFVGLSEWAVDSGRFVCGGCAPGSLGSPAQCCYRGRCPGLMSVRWFWLAGAIKVIESSGVYQRAGWVSLSRLSSERHADEPLLTSEEWQWQVVSSSLEVTSLLKLQGWKHRLSNAVMVLATYNTSLLPDVVDGSGLPAPSDERRRGRVPVAGAVKLSMFSVRMTEAVDQPW